MGTCTSSDGSTLTDEATLEEILECLLKHVPLELEGSSYPSENLFEILLRAAGRHDSIEHTAQRWENPPATQLFGASTECQIVSNASFLHQ